MEECLYYEKFGLWKEEKERKGPQNEWEKKYEKRLEFLSYR